MKTLEKSFSDRLAMDILGQFLESSRGSKYVLAVTDYISKWAEMFPAPHQTSVICAKVILNEVIVCLSCCYNILSDQDHNNENATFTELSDPLEKS